MNLDKLRERQWKLMESFSIADLANPVTRDSYEEAQNNIKKEMYARGN